MMSTALRIISRSALLVCLLLVAHAEVLSRQGSASLYPGEEFIDGAGFPALVKFKKGRPGRPLIVFIPGAAHLARIAYGCPTCDERDFAEFWFTRRGFSFLAISYPLEHPVYTTVYPDFTVREWGRQAARVTKQIIDKNNLDSHVILIGWSMGGKIAQPFYEAAGAQDIVVDFYVALAATPPLPKLLSGELKDLRKTARGLAQSDTLLAWFRASVKAQSARAGHEIIPDDIYSTQFLGAFPVNLLGSDIRYRAGDFVRDLPESIEDMGSFEYAKFPLVTTVFSDSPSDGRHTLTDAGTWGVYVTQKVYQDFIARNKVDLKSVGRKKWRRLEAIMSSLPRRLNRQLPGNHFFFVGAGGARRLSLTISNLAHEVESLKKEIADCLNLPAS